MITIENNRLSLEQIDFMERNPKFEFQKFNVAHQLIIELSNKTSIILTRAGKLVHFEFCSKFIEPRAALKMIKLNNFK